MQTSTTRLQCNHTPGKHTPEQIVINIPQDWLQQSLASCSSLLGNHIISQFILRSIPTTGTRCKNNGIRWNLEGQWALGSMGGAGLGSRAQWGTALYVHFNRYRICKDLRCSPSHPMYEAHDSVSGGYFASSFFPRHGILRSQATNRYSS